MTAPSGWTLGASTLVGSFHLWAYYIAASATRSGSESFSIYNSGSTGGDYPFMTLTLVEYHQQRTFVGVDTSNGVGSGGSGSTSPACTVTVTGAGELVITGVAAEADVTWSSPTNSFTIVQQDAAVSPNSDTHTSCYLDFFSTTGANSYGSQVTCSGFAGARSLTVAFM